jgi:GTP-binding protein
MILIATSKYLMPINFQKSSFVTSAVKPQQYPFSHLPEVALAGRSNVGKSTLLNHLFRHKIVKVSSTPGKTQLINFFNVDDTFMCVDLPGYGYAKVPHHIKKQWGPMMQSYLSSREQLKLLLFLLDIRRTPNEDDLIFLNWALQSDLPCTLVLTKIDKVKNNERLRQTRKILDTLDRSDLPFVYYSATKNIGRKELITSISNSLNLG